MTNLSPLEKAQAAMAEKRAAGEIERLSPIEKARRNPASLRLAINGKCWDCVGCGVDPNPRKAIGQCCISDCTLWPVRPYQRMAESDNESAPEEDDADASVNPGKHIYAPTPETNSQAPSTEGPQAD
ncbi:hypothetical protein [Methylococcus mesophilus]|uniref:hypothetical protein n=1 Tax=Methylococcus mesophilus TaxID=2993564 RepID=UPI00224ACA27|nr:hypothetical protein [Methylococcus mesophilus]UZR27466.1 hypothetical protein OOT43_12050 [Methylococcus mesophilus]